ncbi:MAG: TrkA family potassium uptake protein [Candidatus Omnitrophica bacterium]|nr:TrkA family potassium uptake protein [Candidatus Omnitrophota bacterium]MCM8827382.1 TrkA family potassium uptake protein [Candidatus Omnitrophota bacterium]
MYVIVVGCGRVGSELAKFLSNDGHNVVVIDKSQVSFRKLGNAFNGITLVGNGFSRRVLQQAGIENADAFCALTNIDNTNLLAAQVAKKIFNVPRVIARVYDPERAEFYTNMGLEIISGTVFFSSLLRDKLTKRIFSSYLLESREVSIVEVEVKEQFVDKKIEDINMPEEFLIIAIKRGEELIIPHQTLVKHKDVLIGIAKSKSLNKIKKRLGI